MSNSKMAINLKRDLCDNSRHVGGVLGSVWRCLRRGGIFPGPGPRDKSDLTLTTDHSHPRPERAEASLVIGHSAFFPLSGWSLLDTRPCILP